MKKKIHKKNKRKANEKINIQRRAFNNRKTSQIKHRNVGGVDDDERIKGY